MFFHQAFYAGRVLMGMEKDPIPEQGVHQVLQLSRLTSKLIFQLGLKRSSLFFRYDTVKSESNFKIEFRLIFQCQD